jgi:hypothetical protein
MRTHTYTPIQAEDTDELPFKVGEQIEVLDASDAGWWEGRSCSSGKQGIFPVNYVEEEK